MTNEFYDFLLDDPGTDKERSERAHTFINRWTAKHGDLDRSMATDIGLWILYGPKDVTVRTQIALGGYKCEKASLTY